MFSSAVLAAVLVLGQAATPVLDQAASRLRSDPVYVDDSAEQARGVNADRLRQRIRSAGVPVYVAVLPASAIAEAGGDANEVPRVLGRKVNLAGTYAAIAGNSFRAVSSTLRQGEAGSLATAAFQAHRDEGPEAVLAGFVDRLARTGRDAAPEAAGEPFEGGESGSGDSGGSGSLLPLVLLVGAGGAGLYFWQKGKRRREERALAEDFGQDRSLLQAELSVLGEDVLALDPQIALHPEARADYDAAASRFRVAQAALERADDGIDLERVGRVINEGRYAMSRAKAIVDGREPPPPPAELTRAGRRGEPPLDLDDDNRPAYRGGYGEPFYGGGWFGGGGGLLTGLFLGQMLGGGWGGHHETNVYVDEGGGDGGDGGGFGDGGFGGGDWGGDFGGDFGGGDFGGGDFGGGDFGGGDFGGGDF